MIYFVGAGCGSIDYMTVKGNRLLHSAEVVLYSSLIDDGIIKYCKKNCYLINIDGFHTEDICNLLESQAGKKCVFLTNGDFSFFGLVQVYWDFLKKKKISFEIVPGITAVSACTAVLANECMIPGISKCTTITYLEDTETFLSEQSIQEIAKMNGTIVIYMMNEYHIPRLKRKLLEGGMDKNTPIVAVSLALRKDQKVFYSTIKDMEKLESVGYLVIYLVGWVFANERVRRKLANTPFKLDFHRTELFRSGGKI